MKAPAIALVIASSLILSGTAYYSPSSNQNGGSPAQSAPGTLIDVQNVDAYGPTVPPALEFAIKHGMRIMLVPENLYRWPQGYQHDTEQFASQVGLDANDDIQNYTAGLPFPNIDVSDPKAGIKVAYNWRWAPFLPREIEILTEQKVKAYRVDAAEPTSLFGYDAQSDYRNENNCEQMTIARFAGARPLNENTSKESEVDLKERGGECGPERAAVIDVRYLDPHHPDDLWAFLPGLRKWRRVAMLGGYPHQSCTYACTQMSWEYMPPKTEVYSYKLLGKRNLIACLDTKGSTISRIDSSNRFGEQTCQLRQAYFVQMTPRSPGPENILRAIVFIDAETYLYLGGEFFRDDRPDVAVPFWQLGDPDGGTATAILADDLYVPADRPNFILSLNLDSATEKLDSKLPENLFNPKAQEYSPR